jgi:pimeloyl-ACP methyl ester carboxylesterase
MARFVLVHGAFGGAWCWDAVRPQLEAAGHTVETLDLPGSGDDQTPVAGVTLESYAGRVCEVLGSRREQALLVGHSMGGIVATQAAAQCPEKIASLVFVCAFMPANGQSLLDLAGQPEGADDQIQANIAIEGDPPVAVLSDEAVAEAIYNRCSPEQRALGVARNRPQPVAPFATPVAVDDDALAKIPRSYVIATEDHSIPLALQRRMVSEHPCRRVVELETDHAPYLSATDELVAALLDFAR